MRKETPYKYLLAGVLLATLLGCKHPLAIEGSGDIVEVNEGIFGCTLEQFEQAADSCVNNTVTGDYHVKYQGVPAPGWEFVGWEGMACAKHSEAPFCQYDADANLVEAWDDLFPGLDIPATVAVFKPAEGAALASFTDSVSDPIVQGKCVLCHFVNGLASNSRLHFVRNNNSDYHALNYQQFVDLAGEVEDITDLVLSRVKGVGHPGGIQLQEGSADYNNMEAFLRLLAVTP